MWALAAELRIMHHIQIWDDCQSDFCIVVHKASPVLPVTPCSPTCALGRSVTFALNTHAQLLLGMSSWIETSLSCDLCRFISSTAPPVMSSFIQYPSWRNLTSVLRVERPDACLAQIAGGVTLRHHSLQRTLLTCPGSGQPARQPPTMLFLSWLFKISSC